VKCAAFELPFTTTEQFGRHASTDPSGAVRWADGHDVQAILGILAEQGLVHRSTSSEDLDARAGRPVDLDQ
jgi:hypothetical protein